MNRPNNYRSMPIVLATVSVGFLLATIGLFAGLETLVSSGVLLIALFSPLALAYLHFIVLTDAPWWSTWSGFVLGSIGCGLLLSGTAGWQTAALFGVGFSLIGLSFILSPSKPAPPGVFFILGGVLTLVHAFAVANTAVLGASYAALAITFGIGGTLSARNLVRGEISYS